MSHMLKLIPAIMLSAVLTGCGGAEEDSEVAPYSQDQEPSTASLVLEAGENVHPGDRLRGAIVIALASGWHTYGDPPGDSGMPPAVSTASIILAMYAATAAKQGIQGCGRSDIRL